MRTILLDDYNLTSTQTAYSCFISEYGLQHMKTAWKEKDVIHGMIGVFELLPLVGFIISLFERIIASRYLPTDPSAIPLSFIRYTVIQPGSQVDCSGAIEIDQAKQICQKLNSKNTNGIFFSESKLVSHLYNGTCSAMSFDFANRYLELRKTLSPKQAITQIAPDYEKSSQVFRTTQAAFNTICRAPGMDQKDFNRAKIEGMLCLYNRHVVNASEGFDITQNSAISKIRKILKELKPGVHIIRMILPASSDKGEMLGHTTVLIQDEGKQFFYDPCSGTRKLKKGYESTTLCKFFHTFQQAWNTYSGRFYQIA